MKKKLYTSTLLIIVLISKMSYAQSTDSKGLYVNDFKTIIGDTLAENELLQYAMDSGFNYLILYNLYYIHNNIFDITDPASSAPLASFLKKAYRDYGIEKVAAVGETFNSFTTIHNYNMDHAADPQEMFNVYNIEYEFWNSTSVGSGGYYCTTYLSPGGYTCDTAGAFDHYFEQISKLDSLTDSYGTGVEIESETYIGNPTDGQCHEIADTLDRVLVHYYRSSDVYLSGASIYNYKDYRVPALASAGSIDKTIDMMPIFHCGSDYMEAWLTTNSIDKPYDTWLNGVDGFLSHSSDSWFGNIMSSGDVWYRYTCMPEDTLGLFEKSSFTSLKAFPNPTTGKLKIAEDFIQNRTHYEVYSIQGKLIKSGKLEPILDLTNIPSGVYLLLVSSESFRGGAIVTKR